MRDPDSLPQSIILIVEDDRMLRNMAVQMLESEGLPTLGVGSACDGLEALNKHPSFELLITDINMPGMDGLELLWLVQTTYPKLKLMAFSGREHLTTSHLPPAAEFLAKPFTAHQFLARVQRALASPGTSEEAKR